MNPRDTEVVPALRLTTVDALRGVAATAVVWFHLTNGNPEFHSPTWLRASGRQGWLGVEAFFVISGFVIPYALHRSRYTLQNYGSFLLRRVVRLDPPYFASIAVAIALTYLSAALPGFRGAPPSYSALQILSHAAYLYPFFGHAPIIDVYWSLSLEFQYYLLMGLAFPCLASRSTWVRAATLFVFALAAIAIPSDILVFKWLFLFMLGILTFYYRSASLNLTTYVAGLSLAAFGVWATLGIGAAIVGVASALLIAFADIRSPVLLFLGRISYSLYLFHVPFGGRVINAAVRFNLSSTGTVVVTIAAFAVTVGVAYGFYWSIERPARRWAERIPYAR